MSRTKKRTKSKTPRRKSTRSRRRTEKGLYYDEHFGECTSESPVAMKENSGDSVEQHTSVAMTVSTSIAVPATVSVVNTPPHCISLKKKFLAPRGFESFKEWNANPNHLYIGRSVTHHIPEAVESKWHNPYHKDDVGGADNAVKMYEEYLRNKEELLNCISELEGKELGCWCKPGPCHGDVLIRVFNEMAEKELPISVSTQEVLENLHGAADKDFPDISLKDESLPVCPTTDTPTTEQSAAQSASQVEAEIGINIDIDDCANPPVSFVKPHESPPLPVKEKSPLSLKLQEESFTSTPVTASRDIGVLRKPLNLREEIELAKSFCDNQENITESIVVVDTVSAKEIQISEPDRSDQPEVHIDDTLHNDETLHALSNIYELCHGNRHISDLCPKNDVCGLLFKPRLPPVEMRTQTAVP